MYIATSITFLAVAGSVVARNAEQRLTSYASGPEPVTMSFEDQSSAHSHPLSRISGTDYNLLSNVVPSDDESYYTTCVSSYGKMHVKDCETVLGLIIQAPTSPVEGVIRVEPGTCQVWWSGQCMAKVCAMAEQVYNRPYYEKPEVVVGRLKRDAMDLCVRKGESAVVADYWRYTEEGGSWRYFLQKKH